MATDIFVHDNIFVHDVQYLYPLFGFTITRSVIDKPLPIAIYISLVLSLIFISLYPIFTWLNGHKKYLCSTGIFVQDNNFFGFIKKCN